MKEVLGYLVAEARGWMVALVVVGFEILDLTEQGTYWRGDMVLTMDILGASLIIAGPLVAASVAMDTSRYEHSTLRHLEATAPGGARQVLALAGVSVVPVLAAHLVVSVTALTWGAPTWGVLASTRPWLAILLQMVVLVWFGLLGLLIGHTTSPVLAGIMGVVVGYGVTLVFGYAGYVGGAPLLDVGNASTPQIGRGYDVQGIAVRVAVLLTIGVVALNVRLRLGQSRSRLREWGPIAVLTMLMFASAIFELPARRTVVAVEPDVCVSGAATTTCVFPEHQRYADRWLTVLDRLVGAAADAGYEAWDYSTLSEWLPPDAPLPPGPTFTVDSFNQLSDEGAGDLEWISSTITPVACLLEISGDGLPPASFDTTHEQMVSTWALLVGAEEDLAAEALTPSQVSAVMQAWERCELDVRP